MKEKEIKGQRNEPGLLVRQDKYLEAGVHIGTKIKSGGMSKYIYRKRKDGLYVLDLKKIDERIRLAAKELSRYEAEEILVVASRTYSGIAAANFSKITGVKIVAGRFIPGTLTNPHKKGFFEPEILFVCDPRGEKEALREAGKAGVPSIALCDVDNLIKFVDWVIPCNNKGRRSLALIFYLLAREFLVAKGEIKSYDEFKYSSKDFSSDIALKELGTLEEQKEKEKKVREEEIIAEAKQITEEEEKLKKIEKIKKEKSEIKSGETKAEESKDEDKTEEKKEKPKPVEEKEKKEEKPVEEKEKKEEKPKKKSIAKKTQEKKKEEPIKPKIVQEEEKPKELILAKPKELILAKPKELKIVKQEDKKEEKQEKPKEEKPKEEKPEPKQEESKKEEKQEKPKEEKPKEEKPEEPKQENKKQEETKEENIK